MLIYGRQLFFAVCRRIQHIIAKLAYVHVQLLGDFHQFRQMTHGGRNRICAA
jgi:hypothetical protein